MSIAMRSQRVWCAILLLGVTVIPAFSLFHEEFKPGWQQRWKHSVNPEYTGKFNAITAPGTQETVLQVPERSKKYGLVAMLDEPLDPAKGLVLQFEVQFIEGHDCSGGYLKLLPHVEGFTPEQLESTTPYTIMFGPDRCGPQSRVHLIICSKNPITGKRHERHLEDPPAPPDAENKLAHMYTLKLLPDNTYAILIDGKEKSSGSLLDPEEFMMPFQPPKEMPDPDHIKPDDWVEDDEMDDPDAVRPADWDDRRIIVDMDATPPDGWLEDEPAEVPDTSAQEPGDWDEDEDEDGPWERPMIPNPKCSVGCGPWKRPVMKNPAYKGPWFPPRIPNPDFKGPWRQRTIPNPDYYEETSAIARLDKIGAVAIEVWTTDKGYTFGNILLAQDDVKASELREGPFLKKHEKQVKEELERYHANKYGHLPWPGRLLFHLLDQSWMTWAKPKVAPAMQVLWERPHLSYFVLVLPAGIALLSALFAGKRRRTSAAGAGAGSARVVEGEALSQVEVDEYLEEQKRMSRAAAQALKARASQGGQQQQQQQEKGGGDEAGPSSTAGAGEDSLNPKAGEGQGNLRRRPGKA